MNATPTPVLAARGVVKRYGHIEALRGVEFAAYAGEVTALVGDNGAGKSTLVKVLSGTEQPDAGAIELDGEQVRLASPVEARRLGIETVYQDLALAFDLDGAANLFLGRERLRGGPLRWFGVLDRHAMRAEAERSFATLGVNLRDSSAAVGSLSGGQRQSVAVARAVAWASRVVFLDEPTAALGVAQTGRVLDVIRRVRDQGVAVVLISHNMPQVVEVADRIEVLRLGRRVAEFSAANATVEGLVAAMTGATEAAATTATAEPTAGGEP